MNNADGGCQAGHSSFFKLTVYGGHKGEKRSVDTVMVKDPRVTFSIYTTGATVRLISDVFAAASRSRRGGTC